VEFLLQISSLALSHRCATAGIGIAYAFAQHNVYGLPEQGLMGKVWKEGGET
jgi:hypothetical protein